MSHEFQIGFVCVAQADEFRIDVSFPCTGFGYTHNHAFVKRVYNAVSRMYFVSSAKIHPLGFSILAFLVCNARRQKKRRITDTPHKFYESFAFIFYFICELKNYLVDFVGNWHLSLDTLHESSSFRKLQFQLIASNEGSVVFINFSFSWCWSSYLNRSQKKMLFIFKC